VTPGATNLLDLDYAYGTTANNGNVMSQTITVPTVGTNTGFTAVQTYSYDSLNRLQQAYERPSGWTETNCTSDPTQCWKQTFTFDRYGNRRFDEANTTMPASFANQAVTNPTISTSNNRINSTGYSFDAAGNTTRDAGDRKFTYDAENKQVKVESLSPGTDTVTGTIGEYFYDGDGRRVKKHVPSTGEVTIFVYDAAAKQIAEYSTIVAPQQDAKVAYLTNDHLGSPRINTDANGAVTARHDYHPFGEEIATSQRIAGLGYADDTVRKQFTGYERDKESELDFAQARYYSKNHGRFTTVDPIKIKKERLVDPQQINLYSYVRNQPLLYTDSSGEDLRIKVTNVVVRTQKIYDKSTGKTTIVNTNSYRMIVENHSGTRRVFDVTRSSSYGKRGEYGKDRETPPGNYIGSIRTDGSKGFRIELTEPGQSQGKVTSPDTTQTRDYLQIHRNGMEFEGCMGFPKADHARFEETVKTLLDQDKQNNLGTRIYVSVDPRNERDGTGVRDVGANEPNIPVEDQGGDADGGNRKRGIKPPRVSPPLSPAEIQ
jgi:RHS repeat-associated protein